MSETIALIAVAATLFGAILSVIKGYNSHSDKFSFTKLSSSLIVSGLAALALVDFTTLTTQIQNGIIALVIAHVLIGFGVDQGISNLDKH